MTLEIVLSPIVLKYDKYVSLTKLFSLNSEVIDIFFQFRYFRQSGHLLLIEILLSQRDKLNEKKIHE